MTDTPERIWAHLDVPQVEPGEVTGRWVDHGPGAEDEHEYILADLVPQWQPIETAPKDGTPIDLWFPHLGRCENEWYDNGWLTPGTPTHWMPLPPAPQEGE